VTTRPVEPIPPIDTTADPRPLVVGLTGAFGSGCTTAAWVMSNLSDPFEARTVSDELRKEWTARGHSGEPSRSELQVLGDELREASGLHVLVQRALEDALHAGARRIVLDGIRNLGEVRWLRRRLGERFALFAIYADPDERFSRLGKTYGADLQRFQDDDKRDQGEDENWGQQVRRCVDAADVTILNAGHLPKAKIDPYLRPKLERYVHIVEGNATEYPEPDEVLMNLAFGASHATKCLKRQVGAVIARGGEPIAQGFNENPDSLGPCVETYGVCYRDQLRQEHFESLQEQGRWCPLCGKPLVVAPGPPWRCGACGRAIDEIFFPDRAMKWCTALHAEERALINAHGQDLRGCTLYTTTFPCMLCAEKIIQAGISKVVFVDAYPDQHGRLMFQEVKLPVRLFEGVRSLSFQRYFASVQEAKERESIEALRRAAGAP
jgi:deoxycytidylate deaminase